MPEPDPLKQPGLGGAPLIPQPRTDDPSAPGSDAGPRRALITGITGQDGSYLAELLLGKGYEVHGVVRRSSTFGTDRIEHLYADPHSKKGGRAAAPTEASKRLTLHYGDLTDGNAMAKLVREVRPHEVYNLGAQSHVRVSFDQPVYTADAVATGTLKLLEAVRDFRDASGQDVRFYQASSSEQYGLVQAVPQNEDTPFYPRSPYACAKVYAHWITVNYRESYGLHASCGVLFNHESPRRGETFVTRKITRAVGRIKHGLQDKLYLGNLDAKRDWGFAGDYVEMMWRMLQQDEPDDYVIATNQTWTVRQFCDKAFAAAGLDPAEHVEVDARYFRPAEVELLLGDPAKAKAKLGWEPTTGFDELVRMMVDADMKLAAREKTLKDAGH